MVYALFKLIIIKKKAVSQVGDNVLQRRLVDTVIVFAAVVFSQDVTDF